MTVELKIGWLVIDAKDPRSLGDFWSKALELELVFQDEHAGEYAYKGRGRGGTSWAILFGRSTDEKEVKNRLHLDLIPDHDQEAEAARLESLGARRVDIGQRDVPWIVMADPEDNEFCILSPRSDAP